MDNADASSIGMINKHMQPQLQVVKVYPLDSAPVVDSQLWISVIQLRNESFRRLFLRDGHQHRAISVQSALRLLPDKSRKELSSLLKVASKKGGSSSVFGVIRPFPSNGILNNPDVTRKVDKNGHFETQYSNGSLYIKLTSDSHAGVAAAVEAAQKYGWGSINVAGSEDSRRRLWMVAASQGMYVEGYTHTEEDRKSLFMQTAESDWEHVKPEYKPVNFDRTKKGITAVGKNAQVTGIKSNKTQTDGGILAAEPQDLAEEELTYLLMRVQQIEHSRVTVTSTVQPSYPTHYIDASSDEAAPLI